MGEFLLDPDQFFVQVHDGMVVLKGRVERRSMLPWVIWVVRAVVGVVRVENRLAYDSDDQELERMMAYNWLGP